MRCVCHLPIASTNRELEEIAMVRCPVCESVQIGFLVSPRRTSCYYCGATWLQDESQQTGVRGAQRRPDGARARGDEPELQGGSAASPLSPVERLPDLI